MFCKYILGDYSFEINHCITMKRSVVNFVVVVVFLFDVIVAQGEENIVQTQTGAVRGCMKDLGNGKKVKQFFGIPYAKPPVGDLRWKAPEPVQPWNTIHDGCTLYSSRCPQQPHLQFMIQMEGRGPINEDCLSLSIYTPEHASSTSRLPVMVWIHGGGFILGSGNDQDGSYLSSFTDVIVITINYRLGILGFMPFPETSSKGNYGMLDQIAALKWIKENIGSFGGNPDDMTIFGESAGGVAVSLLTLSPLSRGLFHRAISQSGAAGSHWSAARIDSADDVIRKFCSEVGCPSDQKSNYGKIRACMYNVNVDVLLKEQLKGMMSGLSQLTTPSTDGEFLPDTPQKLLAEGKVNDVEQIIGVTQNEGALFVALMNLTNFPIGVIADLYLPKDNTFQAVKDAAIHYYTPHGREDSPEAWRDAYCNFVGDALFYAGADITARQVSKAGKKTFFYVLGLVKNSDMLPDWVGATHAVDIGYLFGVPFNTTATAFPYSLYQTDMERGASLGLMRMWTNFAKTGNPSIPEDGIHWPQFTPEILEYLEITMAPKVKRNFRSEANAFWNEYIPKLKEHLRGNKDKATETEHSSKDEL